MSHVTANDVQQVQSASIPSSGLAKARSVVLGIRRDYACQTAGAAVAKWQAGKPRPRKVRKKVHGKTVVSTVLPHYKPKPLVPAYCPRQAAS
jgi:hypothetical protein